jgi:uncharacterized phage-associated protein
MYDAVLIANKFVELSIKENNLLTNMKLQKLVYIANGVSLAVNDEPLIIQQVEVWPYGPVISSVYHTYKGFGNTKILLPQPVLGITDLDNNAKIVFNDAWKIGGDISAIRLSNWTHNRDSPWSRARMEKLEYIPDEYMKEYFTKFLSA